MEVALSLQWFQSVYCCCGVMPSIASDKLIKIVKNTQKIGTICERKHICSDVDTKMKIKKLWKMGCVRLPLSTVCPVKEGTGSLQENGDTGNSWLES